MANKKELLIIKEIAQRYGSMIDLDKSPSVLAEILANYGRTFPERGHVLYDSTSGGSTGSVGGTSVGGTGSGTHTGTKQTFDEASLRDVMREILRLHRAVGRIDRQLKQIQRHNKAT